MYFSKSVVAFLLQSGALAAVQNVNVGGNQQLIFSPKTVNAAAGDTVRFTFLDQNHTATSGNPNAGCQPSGKFNSGFVPVAAGARPATFDVQITDTNPITVYCAQATHCQVGMVMVINPSAKGATSLAAYTRLTARAKTNTAPAGVNGGTLKGLTPAKAAKKGGKAAKGAKGAKAAKGAAGAAAKGAKGAAGAAAKAAKGKAAGAAKAKKGAKGGKKARVNLPFAHLKQVNPNAISSTTLATAAATASAAAAPTVAATGNTTTAANNGTANANATSKKGKKGKKDGKKGKKGKKDGKKGKKDGKKAKKAKKGTAQAATTVTTTVTAAPSAAAASPAAASAAVAQ